MLGNLLRPMLAASLWILSIHRPIDSLFRIAMFPATATQRARFFLPLFLAACAPAADEPFDVVESTIAEMQEAMEEGRVTSRDLVEAHLLRIAMYEDQVNAVITVNKNALAEADRRIGVAKVNLVTIFSAIGSCLI